MPHAHSHERMPRRVADAGQKSRREAMKDFNRAVKELRAKRETMSFEQIWSLLFDRSVAKNVVKYYLSDEYPTKDEFERKPRQRIIDAFARAARKAKAYNDPWWRLEGLLIDLLGRSPDTQQEFKRYLGDYTFWRLDVHNELVKGRIRLGWHETAGIPFHWHEHTQYFNQRTEVPIIFEYQGPVIVMAQNVCLLSIDKGSLRLTKLRRVNDPKEEPINGMLLTEDYGQKYPFAVKVLLAHESYLAKVQIRENFIRSQLVNAPYHNDVLGF